MMSVNANLIRQSFAQIDTDGCQLARRFYTLLRQQYEPARSWLASLDDSTKEKIFLSLLQLTVNNLHKPEALSVYLEHFGRKYLSKSHQDCSLPHYQAVGKTIIKALETELSEQWDDDIADEWKRVFNYAAGAIRKGATQAPLPSASSENPQERKIQITVTLGDEFRAFVHEEIRNAITAAVADQIHSAIRKEVQHFISRPSTATET